MHKYIYVFLVAIYLLSGNQGFSQGAAIKNTSYNIYHNRLIIDYDLICDFDNLQNVLFFLWDDSYNIQIPRVVFGDIGEGVEPGYSKQVTWDIVQDNELLVGRLRPQLILKDEFYQRKGSGSVLFSILIPGLGDYFVADHRNMKFKPYLRTVSAISLVGLGLKATKMRTRESLYTEFVDPRTNITEYRFYGYGSYNHWLFPHDNLVFLGMGAAIWIYDIIWVANRGGRNDKLRQALDKVNINYNYQNGGEIGFKYNF